MNTQEREQLTQFLQQLIQAQASQKDSEADTLIREASMRQPDAAYLLVQRAMLLDHALQDSRAQIFHLQGELDQARAGNSNGSFPNQYIWGNSSATQPSPAPQGPAYPADPVPAAASTPAPVAAPAASAWGSGMLGNIATTAAGVVAGGFLFQGIEHLLGNHSSNSGLMNGLSSNASTDHHETPAINQQVDDSASNAGVFDTSSVDDFIDDDTGEIV